MIDDPDWEDMIPFAPFDGERGLLVWGITSNGDECCWNVQSRNPKDWTVVVCGDKGSEWSAPGDVSRCLGPR